MRVGRSSQIISYALKQVENSFYIYCSHVASIDLLLPLTEAKFVLGLGCPFLMQFFPGHEFLNDQHLLHELIDLCSLPLGSRHVDPDGKRLLLPHEYAISHHLLQE